MEIQGSWGYSRGFPISGGVIYWGLSTTAIFGDLGGYVFENFKETARNIICYHLSAGNWLQNELPWMTLSGYFMSKKSVLGQQFLNQIVWMSKNNTTSAIPHDQLARLGRHAQLTRCFSAVAELLV